MARKPLKGRPTFNVGVLVTPAQHDAMKREADRAGLPLSTWIRAKALAACEYVPEAAPPLPGQRAIPGTGVADVD